MHFDLMCFIIRGNINDERTREAWLGITPGTVETPARDTESNAVIYFVFLHM